MVWVSTTSIFSITILLVFAPTDRLKLIRNRCVIERSGSVFVLLLQCTVSFRGVCHTTASDLFPFLFVYIETIYPKLAEIS